MNMNDAGPLCLLVMNNRIVKNTKSAITISMNLSWGKAVST